MASTTQNETLLLASLTVAEDALRQLPKASFTELKSFAKPPMACLAVFEGLGVLLEPSKKTWEWTDDKKLMGGSQEDFIQKLLSFDKDRISDEQLTRLGVILSREECKPKMVAGTSQACHALYLWLQAILEYANQR